MSYDELRLVYDNYDDNRDLWNDYYSLSEQDRKGKAGKSFLNAIRYNERYIEDVRNRLIALGG